MSGGSLLKEVVNSCVRRCGRKRSRVGSESNAPFPFAFLLSEFHSQRSRSQANQGMYKGETAAVYLCPTQLKMSTWRMLNEERGRRRRLVHLRRGRVLRCESPAPEARCSTCCESSTAAPIRCGRALFLLRMLLPPRALFFPPISLSSVRTSPSNSYPPGMHLPQSSLPSSRTQGKSREEETEQGKASLEILVNCFCLRCGRRRDLPTASTCS